MKLTQDEMRKNFRSEFKPHHKKVKAVGDVGMNQWYLLICLAHNSAMTKDTCHNNSQEEIYSCSVYDCPNKVIVKTNKKVESKREMRQWIEGSKYWRDITEDDKGIFGNVGMNKKSQIVCLDDREIMTSRTWPEGNRIALGYHCPTEGCNSKIVITII